MTAGQTDIKVEFPLPIVACNLMIEYADFYENIQASAETLQVNLRIWPIKFYFTLSEDIEVFIVYIFSVQGVPPRSLPTPVFALTVGRMFTSATSVEPSITTKRIHFCATPADSANTPSSSTLSHQGQFSYYVKIYQFPLVRNPPESRIM